MRRIHFYKYHGAGNDFVLIDDRQGSTNISDHDVAQICDRHLGVGADGLMLLRKSESTDFEMVYYNSDGKKASMCGNGGRCIVAFAKHLGIIESSTKFMAYDGLHTAEILEWNGCKGIVKLRMEITSNIKPCLDGWFVDTGSPHYVEVGEYDSNNYDVVKNGKTLRHNNTFTSIGGTNVDFVKAKNNEEIFVLTYERGVENETLSCGTGVTASALVFDSLTNNTTTINKKINVETKGGQFAVYFDKTAEGCYENIYLQGPVTMVFEGDFLLND